MNGGIPAPHLERQLADSVLVVAHPDDEILWFGSILSRVGKLVVCFLPVPGQPAWTEGRRRVARTYPLDHAVFLGLTESVVIFGADWTRPRTTVEGLEVAKRPGTLPAFDAGRYRSNFERLKALLEPELAGCANVITHNPWGEYGHEEHVQVYRAVSQVAAGMGLGVWFSNYCSERSYPLMLESVSGYRSRFETFETRLEDIRPIEALYRRHECWTWPFDDYGYFPRECFFRDAPSDPQRDAGSSLPLNFIKVGDRAAGARPSAWRRPAAWRRGLRKVRRRVLAEPRARKERERVS